MPPGATAHHLVAIAYAQTAQLPMPRGHRFLHHAVPGLPPVQLCVWGHLSVGDIVLPFLTQDTRRPICTTRVAKASTAFEAALEVEQACGYGPFLHQGLQRRQIHLSVNGRPVAPHKRWSFQSADHAGFAVGPPRTPVPQPHARSTPTVPHSIRVAIRSDITDGEASQQVVAHRPDCPPIFAEVPHHFGPRQTSHFLSQLADDGHQYQLQLPLTMPLCQGTPLHCLMLTTRQDRNVHFAILDLRRVLCPPTAPFITVQVAPIISFQAIASGLQSIAPRHRPITAAYMNEELIGASHSVCGPVCVITLLSYRQTRSPAAQSMVCLLDTLSEASDREGFQAHFEAFSGDRQCRHATHSDTRPASCPDEIDPVRTSTSTTTAPSLWQEGPTGYPVTFGPPAVTVQETLAQDSSNNAQGGCVLLEDSPTASANNAQAYNPWDHVGPLDWTVETDAACSSGGLLGTNDDSAQQACQSTHARWVEDPWDPDLAWAFGEASPHFIDEPHPWADSFRNATLSSNSSEGLPSGQSFSPWSVWNEAEEQDMAQRHRSAGHMPFDLPPEATGVCAPHSQATQSCPACGLANRPSLRGRLSHPASSRPQSDTKQLHAF